MSLFQQALTVFILLQLVFGFYWYRYKPDLFYVLEQLFKPRYIFTSVLISMAYIFISAFLNYMFRPY